MSDTTTLDEFWNTQPGKNTYRIWRLGMPAVGPGEVFHLLEYDDMGILVKFKPDESVGYTDIELYLPWSSVMLARKAEETHDEIHG